MKRIGSEIVIEPEDIIQGDLIQDYLNELDAITQQLIYARNNLIIMRKIGYFPHHLFTRDHTFWSLIQKALFESTVMLLTKVVSGTEKISLPNLKNKMFDTRAYKRTDTDIVEQAWDEFQKRIKLAKFGDINILQQRLRNIRNNHLAHLDRDIYVQKQPMKPDEVNHMTIDELDQVVDIAKKLFDILCLNVYRQLEFWDYGRPDQPIDVDELLQHVAETSFWFAEPVSEHIDKEYAKLSDEDKAIIDEWRAKLA